MKVDENSVASVARYGYEFREGSRRNSANSMNSNRKLRKVMAETAICMRLQTMQLFVQKNQLVILRGGTKRTRKILETKVANERAS